MKPPVGENAATTVTFKTSFQCSGSFPSAPHCVPESRWVSSAPSTRETQSSQNSFTRGILISFNHKSYTCRFANTSKTDQVWSKYSFCQVSWHNTPELQLRATVQKMQGSAERKLHLENWVSLIKIQKTDTFHPLNGGGTGIYQSQLF